MPKTTKGATPESAPRFDTVPISEIKQGDRFRKNLGDLDALSASLDVLGMLQPIGITPDAVLVFGSRRLAAAQRLGWESVPVQVLGTLCDALTALKAERDENLCRADFAPSEAVEIGRAIEAIEKPKAKERRQSGLKRGERKNACDSRSGKLPERESAGETRDKVAEAVGMGARTYEKAKAVVEAAEAEPERHGDLPAKMDAESVHSAHEELKRRREPEPETAPPVAPEPPSESPAELVTGRINRLCSALDRLKAEAAEIAADPLGRHVHLPSVTAQIEAARKALWQARPTEPCNCVRGGAAANPECKACGGHGVTCVGRVLKGTKHGA